MRCREEEFSHMVNYVSDDKSGHYIKYDCATSVNGVCSDTNSYTKDEWLALYYTNDAQAGKPIKASSLEVLSSKTIPTGKTPVTLFNEGALYNLSTMSKQESYLVFEQDNASLTGSVFSSSTYAICFGISVVSHFCIIKMHFWIRIFPCMYYLFFSFCCFYSKSSLVIIH